MFELSIDELMFFAGRPTARMLYEAFAEKLDKELPDAERKVQKTQITFTNPKVFACVSFLKVKNAASRPKEYIVVTVGLPRQLSSPRIDASSEPYPGRWTHHVLLGRSDEIDDELMGWVRDAYLFSKAK